MAARPAQGQGRIAAAVEEQQRLLAGRERLDQRASQRERNEPAFGGRVAAHIDHLDPAARRLRGRAETAPRSGRRVR